MTDGYELTANWRGRPTPDLRVDVTAGFTAVDTDIRRLRPNPVLPTLPLLATSSIDLLAKATARTKATLSSRFDWRQWTVSIDLARFGSFRAVQVAGEQTYGPVTTVDLSIDYAVTPRVTLGLGVLNLGHAYPDMIADRARTQGGSIAYPEVGGVGTNGREFFARLRAKF